MTIEDQIKDEKLQYDINRETAKISALSSGKNDKYEYLTGGEILPSNQKQIVEQVKFTYSPLGKAFEKQTKTIEDQVKKGESLEALKPKEVKPIRYNKYDDFFINRMADMQDLSKQIDLNNLTYKFKVEDLAPINFIKLKGPSLIHKDIAEDDIALEDTEKDKKKRKLDLGHTKSGNPKDKAEQQFEVIENVINLYESKEKIVKNV